MDERPSGWYDDPDEPSRLRYWDGTSWTERTHEKAPMPAPQAPKPVTRLRPVRESAPRDEARRGDTADRSTARDAADQLPPGASPRPWSTPGTARQDDTPDAPTAGYARRVLAFLVDLTLIMVATTVLFLALIPLVGGEVQSGWQSYVDGVQSYFESATRAANEAQAGGQGTMTVPVPPEMSTAVATYVVTTSFMSAILALLYDFVQIHLFGATLGGRLAGIRVRSVGSGRPAPGRLLLRSLAKYTFMFAGGVLMLIGIPFTVINFIWPLTNPDRRALHDLWTGTRVARRR